MITNNNLALSGLFFGLLGSGLLGVSFLLYVVNKKDYYKLISSYRKMHVFPAPHSFFYMLGFFGAFPVIRFFIKLSKKKKIVLIKHDNAAYSFFDDRQYKINPWMIVFSFLWLATTVCYLLFALCGLLL